MTAQYMKTVDDGLLVCLAVQRTSNDTGGNVGLIWEHSRPEAKRYIMMVPKRYFDVRLR
jgi:hypothetical protein